MNQQRSLATRFKEWAQLLFSHVSFQYSLGAVIHSMANIVFISVQAAEPRRVVGSDWLLTIFLFISLLSFAIISHLFIYSHCKLALSMVHLQRSLKDTVKKRLKSKRLRVIYSCIFSVFTASIVLVIPFYRSTQTASLLTSIFLTCVSITLIPFMLFSSIYWASLRGLKAAGVQSLSIKQQVQRRGVRKRLLVLFWSTHIMAIPAFILLLFFAWHPVLLVRTAYLLPAIVVFMSATIWTRLWTVNWSQRKPNSTGQVGQVPPTPVAALRPGAMAGGAISVAQGGAQGSGQPDSSVLGIFPPSANTHTNGILTPAVGASRKMSDPGNNFASVAAGNGPMVNGKAPGSMLTLPSNMNMAGSWGASERRKHRKQPSESLLSIEPSASIIN